MLPMANELSRLVEDGALQLGNELYPKRARTGGGEVTAASSSAAST